MGDSCFGDREERKKGSVMHHLYWASAGEGNAKQKKGGERK